MFYILTLLAILVSLVSQLYVNSTYSKYSKVIAKKGLLGFEVARKILDRNGLSNIYVVEIEGVLSDHYDPGRKVVKLSRDVYHSSSIAAVSIAAHEVGHAIQDKEGYAFLRFRSFFVPFVNFGSKFGYIAVVIGLIFGLFDFAIIGMVLLGTTLVFQLVTLPVEFDASKRALDFLSSDEIIAASEKSFSKTMLQAAAFTYVASLISTILELFRLCLTIFGNNRD